MTHANLSTVSEEELLAQGYRKYPGEELDIFYNKDICQHVGNCVRGNPEVFEVKRRPWIIADNGTLEDNQRVLDSCPTGALKYLLKDGE